VLRPVDRHPGLPVVESAEDDVRPTVESQSKIENGVGHDRLNTNIGIDFPGTLGADLRLAPPAILGAKQHRTRQIGILDRVQIDDNHVADPEEGEVLEHLVANRSHTNQQHPGFCKPLLLPPSDQVETGESARCRRIADFQYFSQIDSPPLRSNQKQQSHCRTGLHPVQSRYRRILRQLSTSNTSEPARKSGVADHRYSLRETTLVRGANNDSH